MKTENDPHALRNIGPKSLSWLHEIGIHTREDLDAVGAVMAYRIIRHHHPEASLNLLWALVGALTDRHWNALPPEEKARLRAEAAAALEVHVDPPA